MCGISGIVSRSGKPISDALSRIETMNRLLTHRGPDGSGIYISPDSLVALGNTRLAVVDADNNFSLPMRSQDGKLILSYNGEIFNYQEERSRLTKQYGINFSTSSDTEVMLHGLHFEKEEFLQGLDGFWGFAFYHVPSGRFMLGRDLLGERHVFYYLGKDELIFASEIKPILAVLNERPSFDLTSVVSSFRFRSAPPGKTLIQDISRLESGTVLRLNVGKHDLGITRVLKLHPEKWFDFFDSNPSEEQVMALYQQEMLSSCERRIPKEVGYMATLSGGLDSTLVNVFASQLGTRKIKTLYGMSTEASPKRGADLSEQEASRFTSIKLATHHSEFSMLDQEVVKIYQQQAAESFDGIFCEGAAAFNQLALQTKAQNNKVLLLSDGPDELLGGYEKDISAFRLFNYYKGKRFRRSVFKTLARSTFQKLLPGSTRDDFINWSFLRNAPFHFRPAHAGTSLFVVNQLFERGASTYSDFKYGSIPSEYLNLADHLDVSQKMALSYATYSLPDYYNLRTDRGAMRASIESRLPWQSQGLVELMIATPEHWRFCQGQWSKYIFRKLVERHVGKEIAFRGKYGFAYPVWHLKKFSDQLDMCSTIRDSSVFKELPFKVGAKEFLLQPEQKRHQWMLYSLSLCNEQLKKGQYD